MCAGGKEAAATAASVHKVEHNKYFAEGTVIDFNKRYSEMNWNTWFYFRHCEYFFAHHGQTDLNKKSGTMHQTLIFFNIDAQGFRKTKNETPPTWEIGVTS